MIKENVKTVDFTEKQIQIARFAKALGHPARIFIIQTIAKQNCCYMGNIAEELTIAQSTVSQHLKELKSAGLIQGSIEPPKIKYCIHKENWELARKIGRAHV